jgi:hypothetical protein
MLSVQLDVILLLCVLLCSILFSFYCLICYKSRVMLFIKLSYNSVQDFGIFNAT